MACERYRDTLSDVAAGVPVPAGLEAHIARCEACRAELHALRQALVVADDELARLLTAEPPSELATRIRSAVAEAEASPAWRFGWLWPAVAAAAALLVTLVIVVAPRPSRESGPAVEARPPQPGLATRAAEPAAEPAQTTAPVRSGDAPGRPRPVQRSAALTEPEVLVPPGETELLLRLVALVHREQLRPAALGAVDQPATDLAELRPIDIKPLEIVPLDPAESPGT